MSASLERLQKGKFSTAGSRESDAGARAARALARTIEDQIVPRLVVARAPPPHFPDTEHRLVATDEVLELAGLSVSTRAHEIQFRITEALKHKGFNAVCLELLAPAARILGEMWSEDVYDFATVSIGMNRLHEALRNLTHTLPQGVVEAGRRRKILLAQAPGDQHMFGVSMLSTMFRNAGWGATTLYPGLPVEMRSLLRREWFGIVGISLGSEVHLTALAALLPSLRESSRNRSIGIMVGGPLFVAHPEIARQIGADATASDGLSAIWQAENLLTLHPGYC